MKKTIISLVMMTIILLGWCGIVQAASTSMSATNTSPTVGANVTVTVRFSQPMSTADFKFNYDNSKLQYVSNSLGGTHRKKHGGSCKSRLYRFGFKNNTKR